MRQTGSAPAGTSGTSGIEYIRFAASGRNRFVTMIALLAALGGFLFGYDTGIIGQALPFVQKQFHAGTILGIGAIPGAALAISMIFVPHTPRWLVSKGRTQDARQVLERTRAGGEVQAELDSIQRVVRKERRSSLRDLAGQLIAGAAPGSGRSHRSA
jgi:Sugar (and other) transporter